MVHVSISNRCGGHDRIHHRVHNRRSSITLTHNPSRIRSHSAALSEQWVGQFCDGWLGEGAVSNLILCLKGEMRASGPPQTGTSEWDFSRWIFNPPRQGSLGARASGPPQTGTSERAFQRLRTDKLDEACHSLTSWKRASVFPSPIPSAYDRTDRLAPIGELICGHTLNSPV